MMNQMMNPDFNASREAMLREVDQAGFAVVDANLYLDTHPCDAAAIDYYNQMANAYRNAAAAFEAHEFYADIHLVLSGQEWIGVTDMEKMTVTAVDKVTDSVDCDGPVENRLYMTPGKVLIVLPEDAHKVKIAVDGPERVEKAVVKVQMK